MHNIGFVHDGLLHKLNQLALIVMESKSKKALDESERIIYEMKRSQIASCYLTLTQKNSIVLTVDTGKHELLTRLDMLTLSFSILFLSCLDCMIKFNHLSTSALLLPTRGV